MPHLQGRSSWPGRCAEHYHGRGHRHDQLRAAYLWAQVGRGRVPGWDGQLKRSANKRGNNFGKCFTLIINAHIKYTQNKVFMVTSEHKKVPYNKVLFEKCTHS